MTIVAWIGFISIVILVLDWFFRFAERVRMLFGALTNPAPSVEADVRVLMMGADNPNADAGRANPYDRYAAAHQVIQHRNAQQKGR